jgi:hypothetical protein
VVRRTHQLWARCACGNDHKIQPFQPLACPSCNRPIVYTTAQGFAMSSVAKFEWRVSEHARD